MVCLLVVYHLVPTSNHNSALGAGQQGVLFIILFLHQTTTSKRMRLQALCCLSSCSYIKPQLSEMRNTSRLGCLSSCSYIKPQQRRDTEYRIQSCLSSCSYIKPQQYRRDTEYTEVVYHLVPTSNHNKIQRIQNIQRLFIILFLHQTTTYKTAFFSVPSLFIILFLHQTTTFLYSTRC